MADVASVLVAGLSSEDGACLCRRLYMVPMVQCPTWQCLLSLRDSGPFDLLVLAADGLGQDQMDMLGRVRAAYLAEELPIVLLWPSDVKRQAPRETLNVQSLLAPPVDAEDIVREVARLLHLSLPLLEPALPTRDRLDPVRKAPRDGAVDAVRRRRETKTEYTLDILERVVGETPDRAVAEARKLAGLLHDGGHVVAARLAWRLSERLAGRTSGPPPAAWLEEIRAASQEAPRATSSGPVSAPYVLFVDQPATAEALSRAARQHGMVARVAHDLPGASQVVQRVYPEVVVVDPAVSPSAEDVVAFFGGAQASPLPLQLVVWTASTDQASRLMAARLEVDAFLAKPAPPEEVVAMVANLLFAEARPDLHLLVVSHDADLWTSISQGLLSQGRPAPHVAAPETFWEALEAVLPDVVLVDAGLVEPRAQDVCCMIRTDPSWRPLPVLALLPNLDPARVRDAYAWGADDCVGRSTPPAELVARAERLVQRLAGTEDDLRGPAARRRFVQHLNRLQSTATPFALGLLGLDSFHEVNMGLGFETGDQILRRVGQYLARNLPQPGRLVHWCGDQFALTLQGVSADAARQRLDEILQAMSQHRFGELAQRPLHLTFSGGVAEAPRDGVSVDALVNAAFRGLMRAKRSGRAAVVSGSVFLSPDYARSPFDAVVVHPDVEAAAQLQNALEARGLHVDTVSDMALAVSHLTAVGASRPGFVALLHIDMRDAEGIALLDQAVAALTSCRIVVLLAQTSPEAVAQAFKAGAWFVLGADASFPELVQRTREALSADRVADMESAAPLPAEAPPERMDRRIRLPEASEYPAPETNAARPAEFVRQGVRIQLDEPLPAESQSEPAWPETEVSATPPPPDAGGGWRRGWKTRPRQ